jgi:hypothetical protein
MSASSSTYLKSFFHQLSEVVGELTEMFPDDPDFKVFQTYIAMLQRTNPGIVIDTFYDHVASIYEDQINAKNDSFFLEYAAADYTNDMPDIVQKIKGCWGVLSDPSKTAIWQYIYILKELAKRYKAASAAS